MILPCNVSFSFRHQKNIAFSFNNKIVNDITRRKREIHFYGTTFHYYIPLNNNTSYLDDGKKNTHSLYSNHTYGYEKMKANVFIRLYLEPLSVIRIWKNAYSFHYKRYEIDRNFL